MSNRKNLYKIVISLGMLFFLSQYFVAQEPPKAYLEAQKRFCRPLTYKDKESGIILYVETNGRHISAINKDGEVIWLRNPFEDANLKAYRVDYPQITYLGAAQKWMIDSMIVEDPVNSKHTFVEIDFNSSQFGVINLTNGKFTFMGQD
ncbi:MAG: hypothetical protein HY819_05520 [Acidobacteria bacterium]|nr:hypothetical protein [Acidobacteriota bacterium]